MLLLFGVMALGIRAQSSLSKTSTFTPSEGSLIGRIDLDTYSELHIEMDIKIKSFDGGNILYIGNSFDDSTAILLQNNYFHVWSLGGTVSGGVPGDALVLNRWYHLTVDLTMSSFSAALDGNEAWQIDVSSIAHPQYEQVPVYASAPSDSPLTLGVAANVRVRNLLIESNPDGLPSCFDISGVASKDEQHNNPDGSSFNVNEWLWVHGTFTDSSGERPVDQVNGRWIRVSADRYELIHHEPFVNTYIELCGAEEFCADGNADTWVMLIGDHVLGFCDEADPSDCGGEFGWRFNFWFQTGGGAMFGPCHGCGQLTFGDPATSVSAACEPSLHWVVAGNPSHRAWNNRPDVECMANDETRASQSSSHRGPDIAVTCCSDDGSVERKFGNNNKCKRAKTYAEAYDFCADRGDGFRLCTLDEMRSGMTKGHGCYNDWRYNWVSTPCDVEGVTEVSAPMDGLAFNEVIGSDGAAASASNAVGPMVIGAAAGAALMAVIVAVVVAMRKRLSAKDSELEMADAVHVDDGHISHVASVTLSVPMDAVEVAANAETEKETEAEVEVVTATEMDTASRNEC